MSHTSNYGNTSFIHDGDYSGIVTIITSTQQVEVDFDDLKAIVAAAVRQEKISRLENATNEELLGL